MKWTEEYRVSNLDTDINQNLSLTGIMRYMQDTAFFHMEGTKPSYGELFSRGMAFMINRLTLEVYKEIKSHEKIQLETWMSENSTPLTYDHCFRILSGGKVAAEAITVWSLFDFENRKFIRYSDFESGYYKDSILPLDIPKRLKIPADVILSPVGEYTVSYRDCDMNMHMNNTVYGDVFCGFIPDMKGKSVVHFDMNYRSEARLGERVKVQMSDSGSGSYYFRSNVGDTVNAEAYIVIG